MTSMQLTAASDWTPIISVRFVLIHFRGRLGLLSLIVSLLGHQPILTA